MPRVLQRDYGRLSKFVTYAGQHSNLPLPFQPLVPFVLYFIPPFDRRAVFKHQQHQLSNKLDTPPDPVPLWIKAEITSLLRMSDPDR